MIHLVFGPQEFLRREAVAAAVQQHLGEGPRDLGTTRLDADQVTPATLSEALEAYGLFGDRRVVVLNRVEALKGDRLAALQPHVERFADTASEEVLLVLVSAADRRPDLGRGATAATECAELRRGDALPWLQRRAQRIGIAATPAALRQLAERVGPDPGILASELDKVAASAGGRSITDDDVREMVTPSAAVTPYAWYDAVGGRDSRGALAGLQRLLLDPEYPAVRLLVGLGIHLTNVALARAALDAGQSPRAVVSMLGGWMGDKYVAQASGWTTAALDRAIDALRDADIAVKSGRGDAPVLRGLLAQLVMAP